MIIFFPDRSKWEPDPALPFVPPKHLKMMIDNFEINEAPSIGLTPRLLGGTENLPTEQSANEDLEFFVS